MRKIRKKQKLNKNNNKSFIFPIIALFAISFSSVLVLILVGGSETIYYFQQLNYVPDQKVICIDPGHGGTSSGATNGNRLEKDDDLRLSLLVRDILEERGYTVVMTRTDDSDVSLEERCKIANKSRASLFVSIHRNSTVGDGKGIEMWVHSSNPTDDMLLAENILRNLEAVGFSSNRGIHSGYREGADLNYYINRNTKMPSVLAEIGFISNADDNKAYDENIEKYAKTIADGIELTLKEMNG
jgi:N-acetylmuramoyl-L-alanine amidase